MKKTNSLMIILGFIFLVFLFPKSSNAAKNTSVHIHGKSVEFNEEMGQPFLDENSRIQVPFRVTLESVGAKVNWDPVTQTASAKKDDINIEIPIGEKYILRNGVKIDNDTKAIVKAGRTFLPIRVVMEALGYNVEWDGKNSIVKIDTLLVTADSYLQSIVGVWYLDNHNYIIEISKDGKVNGAFLGSEYDFKGSIKSKEYNGNTNSLKTLLNIEIFDMGNESEYMNTTYVFNKISKDKLKITYENGETDDFIYIGKDIGAGEEFLNPKDKKETIINEPPVKYVGWEYLASLAGVWHNPSKHELLFIDKDLNIYVGSTYNGIGDISVLRNYDYEFFTSSINVWYTTDNSTRWFYKEKDGSLTVSYNDPFNIYTVDKYKYIAPTISEANLILKDVIKADKDLFSIKGKTPEDRANTYMWKKLPPMTN